MRDHIRALRLLKHTQLYLRFARRGYRNMRDDGEAHDGIAFAAEHEVASAVDRPI